MWWRLNEMNVCKALSTMTAPRKHSISLLFLNQRTLLLIPQCASLDPIGWNSALSEGWLLIVTRVWSFLEPQSASSSPQDSNHRDAMWAQIRVYGTVSYLSSCPSEHSLWSQTWTGIQKLPHSGALSPEANILRISVSPSVVIVAQWLSCVQIVKWKW